MKRLDPPDDRTCRKPLPDGSRCHACRIYDALIAAERVLEPHEEGMLVGRCLNGVADAMANLLMGIDDESARYVLEHVYRTSRDLREQFPDAVVDDEHEEMVGHA